MLNAIVLAAAFSLCWTAPTTNTDGSPISGLIAFTVYWGDASGAYDQSAIIAPNVTCADVPAAEGQHYVVMTAIDLEGDESAYSNEVLKQSIDDSPQPPVILAQEETVYTVIKQPNRFLLLPIGTVPAGTACDPNHSVNGFGAVPTDAVVWTSPTGSRPIVVVAQCNG